MIKQEALWSPHPTNHSHGRGVKLKPRYRAASLSTSLNLRSTAISANQRRFRPSSTSPFPTLERRQNREQLTNVLSKSRHATNSSLDADQITTGPQLTYPRSNNHRLKQSKTWRTWRAPRKRWFARTLCRNSSGASCSTACEVGTCPPVEHQVRTATYSGNSSLAEFRGEKMYHNVIQDSRKWHLRKCTAASSSLFLISMMTLRWKTFERGLPRWRQCNRFILHSTRRRWYMAEPEHAVQAHCLTHGGRNRSI